MIAAAIALLIATIHPSFAAPVKLIPVEAQIVKAIDRILAHPLQPSDADDIKKIATYSKESSRITITLNQHFVFVSKDDRDTLCFGFYIAGATKFRLLHPEAAKDPYADVLTSLRAGLVEYRAIRGVDPTYKNEQWANADRLDHQGLLAQWIDQTIRSDKSKAESPKTS